MDTINSVLKKVISEILNAKGPETGRFGKSKEPLSRRRGSKASLASKRSRSLSKTQTSFKNLSKVRSPKNRLRQTGSRISNANTSNRLKSRISQHQSRRSSLKHHQTSQDSPTHTRRSPFSRKGSQASHSPTAFFITDHYSKQPGKHGKSIEEHSPGQRSRHEHSYHSIRSRKSPYQRSPTLREHNSVIMPPK